MIPSASDRPAAPEEPLVGRVEERRTIDVLLADGERLVVLHGTAGAGKSRLALAVTQERHDPLLWCALEGETSAEAVTRELAAQLEIPLGGGDASAHEKRVLDSLAARGRQLLVLDACESLDDRARALVARVLAAAPGVRVLATSRRSLGIDNEQRVEVGPLPEPEATELFVARTRAARPTLALRSHEDRAALAEIVRALEGLPLALELAAARLRVVSPTHLCRMLVHRLDVLTGPSAGRHASLAVALDASWELLAAEDRRALVVLARFVGPFALETAASALSAETDVVLREIRASERIDELVRASLVGTTVGQGDAPSFALLESVRAYAKLHAAEVEQDADVSTRFADAVLSRAEAMVARSRREPGALRTLFAETRTIEAVLAWGQAVEDDERTIRALACLARGTALRGPPGPFLETAARVRARASAARASDAIALSRGIGQVATSAGRFADACAAYETATQQALASGRADLAALFESRIALLAQYLGDDPRATALLAQALGRLVPGTSDEIRGRVHEAIGVIAVRRGERVVARGALDIALAAARSAGVLDLEGRALGFLAWCDLEDGRFEAAQASFVRASVVCASMAERRYADAFAGDVGLALYEQGRLDEARSVLEEAVQAHVRRGDRWYEAEHLGHMGMVVFARGDLGEAKAMLGRASSMHEAAKDRGQAAIFRALEGAVAVEARDLVHARRAFAEARALAADVDTPAPKVILLLEGALALAEPSTDPARAAFADAVARARETAVSDLRMAARALAASLARVEARERDGATALPTALGDAGSWSDPLYATLVKRQVQARLFGGAPEVLRIGRFEVLGRIGAGAMSVVYAARDPELGRNVALKLLQEEVHGERLRREARALARLRHPHVVTVYDVGTWNRHFFVALELVEGRALGAWRSAEPRTVADVVRVMSDVADGLAAVHEIGLVHRDVKPDNIVVDASGRARLVDFGLVSAEDDAPRGVPISPRDAGSLTRPGASPGTPRYMAPECKEGAPATPLSDQFSFAVSLAEALEGLDASASIVLAMRRGCEIDPAQRFASMRALHEALRLA